VALPAFLFEEIAAGERMISGEAAAQRERKRQHDRKGFHFIYALTGSKTLTLFIREIPELAGMSTRLSSSRLPSQQGQEVDRYSTKTLTFAFLSIDL
jgi:hypothetical protein